MRAIAANAITILAFDPKWAGVLAYDEFAETIVTRTTPPWRDQDRARDTRPGDWTDEDTVRLQAWIADAYGIDLGLEATLAAVKVAAARTRFHPVQDWLQSLKWDATRRVGTWLTDILGCDDTPYVREVGSSFLISAVARVMTPGCKVDTLPILEGEQGSGKSSVIRAIAGDEWFLEMSITDITSKDAMQVLKRKWIAEFPEWDGFTVSEASHVKGYCSRQVDTYRPSYGKGTRDFPRQAVFAASTNRTDWNTDETGARRYNPIRCRAGNVPLARQLRDQLWAEALAMFQSGVPWHVTDPELAVTFRVEQDARYRAHPWEERIAAWLDRPIDLPAGARRAELGVTTADVLSGIGLDVTKWTHRDANIVAACLRRLGWRQGPQRRRGGVRVRPYFPAGSDPDMAELGPDVECLVELRPNGVHAPAGWPTDEEMLGAKGE